MDETLANYIHAANAYALALEADAKAIRRLAHIVVKNGRGTDEHREAVRAWVETDTAVGLRFHELKRAEGELEVQDG